MISLSSHIPVNSQSFDLVESILGEKQSQKVFACGLSHTHSFCVFNNKAPAAFLIRKRYISCQKRMPASFLTRHNQIPYKKKPVAFLTRKSAVLAPKSTRALGLKDPPPGAL